MTAPLIAEALEALKTPPEAGVWGQKTASRRKFQSWTPNVWEKQVVTTDSRRGNDIMHARYYAFNLGRFMSVDPVGGEVGLSQSWNRYAYVRGNPVNAVDPDGLQEVPKTSGMPHNLRDLLRRLPSIPVNANPNLVWMAGSFKRGTPSPVSILDIADKFESFRELWDLATPRGKNPNLRDVEGNKEQARAVFDRMVDDATVVDKSKDGEVIVVGKDRKTGRTVIYRTRQSEKGAVATIEEQRVTPKGRKRKKEIRFRPPHSKEEDPPKPDDEY